MHEELIGRAYAAFRSDMAAIPPMSLRGGNAVDGYQSPPPYDPQLDRPTDQYLERYYWGLAHLDAASWRHYLPRFIEYALRHKSDAGAMVVDGLLASLRPPDREPPRLDSLTAEQEAVVVACLDVLAFEDSVYQASAMQVLEEYWVPNALYRKRPSGDT